MSDNSRKIAKFSDYGRRCYCLSIAYERLDEPYSAFLHTRLGIGKILEFVAANLQPLLHAVHSSELAQQSDPVDSRFVPSPSHEIVVKSSGSVTERGLWTTLVAKCNRNEIRMVFCAKFAQDSTGLISDGASQDARGRSELNLVVKDQRCACWLGCPAATYVADLMVCVRIERPLHLRTCSLSSSIHAQRQEEYVVSRLGKPSIIVVRQANQRRFEPRACGCRQAPAWLQLMPQCGNDLLQLARQNHAIQQQFLDMQFNEVLAARPSIAYLGLESDPDRQGSEQLANGFEFGYAERFDSGSSKSDFNWRAH